MLNINELNFKLAVVRNVLKTLSTDLVRANSMALNYVLVNMT